MSIDFIPLVLYTPLFYYILLVVSIVMFFELSSLGLKKSKWGWFLVFFIIIYMGFRPISGKYFVDMGTYALDFENYKFVQDLNNDKDIVFYTFMKLCAGVMTVNLFFLTCAVVYIYPLVLVSKKWFQEYWFYAFLFLVVSFSFWSYGTNGIRNGMASSLFLLGVSRDKRINQYVLIFLSFSVHKSMMLPAFGFALAQIFNKPKILISFWIFCIPLSLAAGGWWESFFSNFGFEDDRISYLTEGNVNGDEFSKTGFRWDFLLYSATAVFAGWFYIVRRNYKDKVYFWLFNTYVFSNAFWILVIRANFSNRFAYLSWFMIALVIIYPFLKQKLISNQHKILANILLVYFSFTFIMNVIFAKL